MAWVKPADQPPASGLWFGAWGSSVLLCRYYASVEGWRAPGSNMAYVVPDYYWDEPIVFPPAPPPHD